MADSSSTTTKVILYANDAGSISLETIEGRAWSLLHIRVNECQRVRVADGNGLLSALQAFYDLNQSKGILFVQAFDINSEHIPDLGLIMGTLSLMRQTHAHFMNHLVCTCVVAHEHAQTCRTYLSRFVPTKQIFYLGELDEIVQVPIDDLLVSDIKLKAE